MKIFYTFLILTPFVLASCNQASVNDLDVEDQQVAMEEQNCVNSGGTYEDDTCICPEETYEFNGEQVPLYTLDNGQCVDAMGVPGGVMGEEVEGSNPLNQ